MHLQQYLEIRIGNQSRHQARRLRRASMIHALWEGEDRPNSTRNRKKSTEAEEHTV